MLRIGPRTAFGALAALAPLALGGCADTLTGQSTPSSSQLRRDYDKTLSPTEQQAVIGELKAEAKPKGETQAAGKPAEKQD